MSSNRGRLMRRLYLDVSGKMLQRDTSMKVEDENVKTLDMVACMEAKSCEYIVFLFVHWTWWRSHQWNRKSRG